MNPDWHNFLLQHGATIDKSGTRFGDLTKELIATLHDTVLCALSHFGVLRVSGDEAQPFLQNLLSNDIGEVSATRAQLSSFNTAKGRMLASMLIWRDGDDYLLQLPQVLCEPIRKKLSMYILRAKVSITDASNDIISLGLSGSNVQKILVEQFGEFPSLPFGVTTTSHGFNTQLHCGKNSAPTRSQLPVVVGIGLVSVPGFLSSCRRRRNSLSPKW
jgi:folate-binding Fe-S cluster repair protein YgfZ